MQTTKTETVKLQNVGTVSACDVAKLHSHAADEQGNETVSQSNELHQIQLNRKELLETGVYSETDELILELDARIHQLLTKQKTVV